jgi:hypothetical protein
MTIFLVVIANFNQIRIREVLGSSLGRNVSQSLAPRGFLQTLEVNATVAQPSLPSKPFPVHHSYIHLPTLHTVLADRSKKKKPSSKNIALRFHGFIMVRPTTNSVAYIMSVWLHDDYT